MFGAITQFPSVVVSCRAYLNKNLNSHSAQPRRWHRRELARPRPAASSNLGGLLTNPRPRPGLGPQARGSQTSPAPCLVQTSRLQPKKSRLPVSTYGPCPPRIRSLVRRPLRLLHYPFGHLQTPPTKAQHFAPTGRRHTLAALLPSSLDSVCEPHPFPICGPHPSSPAPFSCSSPCPILPLRLDRLATYTTAAAMSPSLNQVGDATSALLPRQTSLTHVPLGC